MSLKEFRGELNRFVHVAGRDEPPMHQFAQRLVQNDLPVVNRSHDAPPAEDYLLIDPMLMVTVPEPSEVVAVPDPRLGYAGYTPQQRFELLEWLPSPTHAAPLAFQNFYLAHLEMRLFASAHAGDVLLELQTLQGTPTWQGNESLGRVLVLAHWLKKDGLGLTKWLEQSVVDARTLSVALGIAGLLEASLSSNLLVQIWASWRPQEVTPPAQILQQHLLSLSTTLGQEPLAHALAQLPAEAHEPRPWRGLHRDLRIALPQPDLRPVLEPLLAEMVLAGSGTEAVAGGPKAVSEEERADDASPSRKRAKAAKGTPNKTVAAEEERPWLLVLEFGHSRSEYFDYVLHRARELAGFTQIMDEDRQIVYRVHFRKRDMRLFWRLWDYVQNWSNTHVYIQGKELEKWKIWPYSQYLK